MPHFPKRYQDLDSPSWRGGPIRPNAFLQLANGRWAAAAGRSFSDLERTRSEVRRGLRGLDP